MSDPAPQPADAAAVSTPAAHSRLVSLDAFRGLVIALMFFVNLSASRAAFPEWFGHAGWNGGRHGQWLADYVFPWFLFIVGCAIPFSMHGGRGRALSPAARVLAAVRRALLIYALGILIWMAKTAKDTLERPGTPITWQTLLHWDILPLIALGYLVAVALYHAPRWAQVGFVLLVLLAKFLTMPDLAATAGLERKLFMAARTDLEARTRELGFLGTAIAQGLPAAATVVLGALCGDWLRAGAASPVRRSGALLAAGGAMTAAALAWTPWHPVSKDFFTSTYVLLSAGTAAMLLALLHAAVDARRISRRAACVGGAVALSGCIAGLWWAEAQTGMTAQQLDAALLCLGLAVVGLLGWAAFDIWRDHRPRATLAFFAIYGSNALAVYVLAELSWTLVWMHWRVMGPAEFGGQLAFPALQAHWSALARPLLGPELGAGVGPWLASLTYVGLFWLLCWWLWRRKIFIKV